MLTRTTISAVAALVLLAASAGSAAAQESPPQAPTSGADREARSLFDAGSQAFSEGRYANALEYFRRAYELSGRPQLLFNIGGAAERLRRDDEALEALREFLVQVPDSDQRAAVEARIAILEVSIAERARTAQPTESASESAATTEPVAAPPESGAGSAASHDLTGPIALIASGGAVCIAGGVLLGVAVSDVSSVENAPQGARWSTVSEAYSRSEALSIAGAVALGVGAAVAIGGVVWLALPSESSSSGSAELLIGPGSVAVRRSF